MKAKFLHLLGMSSPFIIAILFATIMAFVNGFYEGILGLMFIVIIIGAILIVSIETS